MKFLLALCLFLAVALGQNTCFRPLVDTEFTGVLPFVGRNSPVLDNLVAGWTTTIRFGENNAISELQTNGTHTLTFQAQWVINNLVLQVNYASGTSSTVDDTKHVPLRLTDFDCDSATTGQYQVKWDCLCTRVTLELVQDFCVPRRFKYSGLQLLRTGNTECPNALMNGLQERVWSGQYVNFNPANELSGLDVCFVIRPGTSARDILEQSFRGTRRSDWKITEHHLHVYDVSSRPKFLQCDEYNNKGIYLINWYTCDRFILTLVSDTCRGRRDVYADIEISKGGTPISPSFNSAQSTIPSLALLFTLCAAVLALF